MRMQILPGKLIGEIAAPPSKSVSHRVLVGMLLARGESRIAGISDCEDVLATRRAVEALKAAQPGIAAIDCGESASTLRFLLPVCAALGVRAEFSGAKRLFERPLEPLTEALCENGADCAFDGGRLRVEPGLRPGRYAIRGDISSQFLSGLLFALPLLPGESEIALTSPLESRGYVDMTIDTLAKFGVRIRRKRDGFAVAGGQSFIPVTMAVEGDYSAAAFWLCGAALGGDVRVDGLPVLSRQPDKRVVPLLERMGARVRLTKTSVAVRANMCKSIDLDVSDCPDLAPVVAATAAFANGVTTISGAGRLRWKESDRLSAMAAGIRDLGGSVIEYPERLVIIGQEWLAGGEADSRGDHRVAMALAVAATACRNPSVIDGAECVAKSYPGFWEDFAALGGSCHVV